MRGQSQRAGELIAGAPADGPSSHRIALTRPVSSLPFRTPYTLFAPTNEAVDAFKASLGADAATSACHSAPASHRPLFLTDSPAAQSWRTFAVNAKGMC